MYLEEIILDGFKSYANRTVISGFHPKFNAISGANGTGKSNILDGICFVMGIKSLTQMRVSKIEQLIYKQGQAGVSKASVTLIFRNNDRLTSPVDMRDMEKITVTRQIAIGGRERFLLNGHNVRMSDIQAMFQSVQLNVNHPHFLVAQGRITKVINMKPPEILGLIEECAGTRLYELKRSESTRRISIKESKLEEINKLVSEEIEPAIVNLRKKQEEYAKGLRIAEDISRLEKQCVLHEYSRLLQDIKQVEMLCDEDEASLKKHQHDIIFSKKQLETLQKSIINESQQQFGDKKKLQELIEEEKKMSRDMITISVELKETENDKVKLEKEIEELQAVSQKEEKEVKMILQQSEKEFSIEREKEEDLSKIHEKMDDLRATIEEARTGCVSSNEPKESSTVTSHRSTVRDKIVDAEIRLKSLHAEMKTLEIFLKKRDEEIQLLQKSNFSAHQENRHDTTETEIMNIQKCMDELKNSLKHQDQTIEDLKTAQTTLPALQLSLNELDDNISTLKRNLFHITRIYEENPYATNEGIKGVAAELFHVKEDFTSYTLALEEAGKSRLLNIVVDNDETAKRLLEKYKNLRRITCIPLNRIQAQEISDHVVQKAKRIAQLPNDSLDLVRPCDILSCESPEYNKALCFVFRQTLLCALPEIAHKVTTDASLQLVTITKDGDHYNPAGSISGGSSSGFNGLLSQLQKLRATQNERLLLSEKLRVQEKDYETLKKKRDQDSANETELKKLQLQYDNLNIRLRERNSIDTQKSLENLLLEREEIVRKLENLQSKEIPKLTQIILPKLREEEKILQGSNETREAYIAACEKEMKSLKKKGKEFKEALQQLQEKNSDSHRQLTALQENIKCSKEMIYQKKNVDLPALIELKNKLSTSFNDSVAKHTLLIKHIEKIKKAIGLDKEAGQRFNESKQELEIFIEEAETKNAKLSHNLAQNKKLWSDLAKKRSVMLREKGWVATEVTKLNDQNEPFNLPEKLEKLQLLRDSYDTQRKHNKNVIALLETSEREFQELKEKKTQLIRDKKKLEQFIEELDIKKREVLETCWKQVNESFSEIFSNLLPNCSAQLCLTSTNKIEDGLEMQVMLTGVTKKFLGELSGGQKSLLALSLILGLLKYKPAPFYILDEIDAALDINHTQRIGHMIKSQFGRSQFLIVSLKQNLFNYADVLFRTCFKNGTSCVIRETNDSDVDKKRKKNELQR